MDKHNFRKLDIWIKSMSIVKDVYLLVSDFPNDEKYGLKSQITRCAVSVPSNIAEGSGRSSKKEFSYFLTVALGPSYELETQLIISNEIFHVETNEIIVENQNLQKMILGFKNKIMNN